VFFRIDYLQRQFSTKCSNIGTELIIDYSGEFTTYEIFQSRGIHAKLKRYICSSLGSFDTSWAKIHALLELQHTKIKASFEKSINIVLYNFKLSQFKLLRSVVSTSVLKKIIDESKRFTPWA